MANRLKDFSYDKEVIVVICFFIGIVIFQLSKILILNSGNFVFSLDDPYIHLALAEKIMNGHYGINAIEPSAPSSSILWPFLIAPISHTSFSISSYLILFFNFLCSIGVIIFFYKIIKPNELHLGKKANYRQASILIFLILTTNLVGLMFMGMEHSLQLLCSVFILIGIIDFLENKKVKNYFLIAIVVAPLIRYECLALSIPALMLLCFNKHYKKACIVGCVLILLFDF